ncbi:hypothetical protein OJ996_09215 [Luteolibacter sp. GHJ8]|uniref:Uncharacterized protein n=1 Tax=Luteolibacter rhizosphaerae TaxID=2989719 RepID=A0ABT3G1N6_9BACT|nr:hypothetical protein [Luteolibacter rhizosphaerae]MCW1913753.1 hypothetical protein [Luteolibacter rhizosphaerae]
MIWSIPAVRVAEQYGISSNALGKICEAMDIPTPPRGYWAKVQAGHQPEKGSLPLEGVGTVLSWKIDTVASSNLREAARKRALQRSAEANLDQPPLKTSLERLHPLIVSTRIEFRQSLLGWKRRSRDSRRWIDLRVSKQQLDRGLLFLENLVRTAEARGICFRCKADLPPFDRSTNWCYRCFFHVDGISFNFRLKEIGARRFQLSVSDSHDVEIFTWRDARGAPIEERIPGIVHRVCEEISSRIAKRPRPEEPVEREARLRAERERLAERERVAGERQEAEKQLKLREAARAAAENTLLENARASQRAAQLEVYLERVERHHDIAAFPEARLWLEWGRERLRALRAVEKEPWRDGGFVYFLQQLKEP